MNIFDTYLEKIKSILSELQKDNKIIAPSNFNGINAEIPPPKFNCDISTNVAMVLSKINNLITVVIYIVFFGNFVIIKD